MMKIGLSSYSLARAIQAGEMDIFGAMDFVKENGGEHIEIVPGAFGEMSVTLAEQIAQKAKNIQLELSSYTIGANFIQENAEAVQAEVE
ncbi:MAG: sugar phosphate isomerase/epimerase, partial [Lentisphaeria bacterium]|nr:sugar phosphate isomerase/epimerase [Lentisphaeria bacterium]